MDALPKSGQSDRLTGRSDDIASSDQRAQIAQRAVQTHQEGARDGGATHRHTGD
jgi:hypothetical protein